MVLPIVAIPASIEAGLAPYRDLFPRSETYQHIKEYCTGLVVLDKPSINRGWRSVWSRGQRKVRSIKRSRSRRGRGRRSISGGCNRFRRITAGRG